MAEGRAAMGPDQVLLGNIDPVRVLRDGTPGERHAALDACHQAAAPAYIVGAGCEVPRGTPDAEPAGPDRLREEPPAVIARAGTVPAGADSRRKPSATCCSSGASSSPAAASRCAAAAGSACSRAMSRSRPRCARSSPRPRLDAGWRLGCLAEAHGPVTLEIDQWAIAHPRRPAEVPFEPADGLGAVVDVGTTTLVAQLVDRATGEVVAVATALNPQARFGADLMSRIHYELAEPGDAARP